MLKTLKTGTLLLLCSFTGMLFLESCVKCYENDHYTPTYFLPKSITLWATGYEGLVDTLDTGNYQQISFSLRLTEKNIITQIPEKTTKGLFFGTVQAFSPSYFSVSVIKMTDIRIYSPDSVYFSGMPPIAPETDLTDLLENTAGEDWAAIRSNPKPHYDNNEVSRFKLMHQPEAGGQTLRLYAEISYDDGSALSSPVLSLFLQ
ncbi:MAG: hypothetical protein ACK417_02665 [Bacteroidia bacterium]